MISRIRRFVDTRLRWRVCVEAFACHGTRRHLKSPYSVLLRTPAIVKWLVQDPAKYGNLNLKDEAHDRQSDQRLEILGTRSHPPAFAVRSILEDLILLQTRSLVWGIKAIVIDYATPRKGGANNWRVVGFISGTADRDQATRALAIAAHRYAQWVMVEDADPRAGEIVTLCESK